MILRWSLFLLIFSVCMAAHAQDTIPFSHLLTHQDSMEFLYKKYLNTKGDPQQKIVELRRLAGIDSDKWSALRKLQIALLLEKQVSQPSEVLFDLNLYTGELIGNINK